jgi:SGNH hydrolase-like domain, acetyltransferase AlgX
MQKKLINGLFLLALCVPALAVFRSPQFVPAMKAVIDSPSEWDHQRDALRRATPLWNSAVEFYSSLLYRLGATNSKAVAVVGRHGWVFLGDLFNQNMAQALGRRVYDAGELHRWIDSRTAQQDWLAHRGIPMLFVIAPAKWSIYPDRLPRWMPSHMGAHSLDLLLAAKGKLSLVDMRPTLIDARKVADTYSPLNSHWTDYGALVAWGKIAEQLGELDPKLVGLRVPRSHGVSVVDDASEFKAMINLPAANRWTRPELNDPLPSYEIVGPDGSVATVPGSTGTGLLELPRVTRNDSTGNHLRALIVRDSMGDALSPYMQAAFAETVQVRHHIDEPKLSPNIPSLVEKYKPDVVVYVMTERLLDMVPDDLDFWRAANAYDSAVASYADWNAISGNGSLWFQGDPALSAAATLYWPPGDLAGHVLCVRIEAKGGGTLQASVSTKGNSGVIGRQYVDGANELFFSLPPGVDGSRLTLTSLTGGAAVKITSIGLRKVSME